MPFDAAVVIRALHFSRDELVKLAGFIDDLDGWGNGDCDTGSNAKATLDAFIEHCEHASPNTVADLLDILVESGTHHCVGHVGVLLTQLFAVWRHALEEEETDTRRNLSASLSPVSVRRMLAASTRLGEAQPWSPAVIFVLSETAQDLQRLGDTLEDVDEVVSTFNVGMQCALIDIDAPRSPAGRIDAGAAVLVIFGACLDAAARQDSSMLATLAQMLADLSSALEPSALRASTPSLGREFALDLLLQGTNEDVAALQERAEKLGARYSLVGSTDFFGMGTWRFHIDTSAPLSLRPRQGRILRFQVTDSRPDEVIGEDSLSDGVTHRGVRLLERKARTRIQRATVITCTRAPGLVEDLARAGAIVLLEPPPEDRATLVDLARTSSCGVALFIPCDEASACAARAASAELELCDVDALVAPSRDELSALALVQACAPIFLPQPGGKSVGPLVRTVLCEASAHAMGASRVIPLEAGPAETSVPAALDEILAAQPRRALRLLLARDSDEFADAAFRQFLSNSTYVAGLPINIEVLDGKGQGFGLLQAII